MERRVFGAACASAVFLAGCSPAQRHYDVAYYLAHPQERAAELSVCRDDPGAPAPNCVNAEVADGAAESRRAWTMPATVSRVKNPGRL